MTARTLTGIVPRTGSPLGGAVAQQEMRAANMGLLLRHLRTAGPRSRAQLASETGLSKATTSSLIADLTERGLVGEGKLVRGGTVGRPGVNVTLDGSTVTAIGLEINVSHVSLTAVTLSGTVVREASTSLDAAHLGIDGVLDRAAGLLRRTLGSLWGAGIRVVGITVALPGVIDYAASTLRFAPNLGWRNIPIAHELAARLGKDAPAIHLENDAKLAAVAEFDYARDDVRDLFYLAGEVGVGSGIIAEGRLVRGWSGFSGEVGHLPLDPGLAPCNCGRRGCWETIVGLTPFLGLAADDGDPVRDPVRPIEDRLLTLAARANAGDDRTLAALAALAERLATGLSIIVDVLNPRMIVLGGYFSFFGDYIVPPLAAALESRRMDVGSSVALATSKLGLMATARGGALLALEDVFDDPTRVPAA